MAIAEDERLESGRNLPRTVEGLGCRERGFGGSIAGLGLLSVPSVSGEVGECIIGVLSQIAPNNG
jgi:hypothetical protein